MSTYYNHIFTTIKDKTMEKFKEDKKSTFFHMLMTEQERKDLNDFARKNGVSSAQIVRVLIREAIKEDVK
jgi:Trp operon repressor